MIPRLRQLTPLLTPALKQRPLLQQTRRILPCNQFMVQRPFSHTPFFLQTTSSNNSDDLTSSKEDDEDEDDIMDPSDYPEEEIDTEWFVDRDYTTDDFVPLWQRQADAQQHLQDRQAIQDLTAKLLADGTLTPEMLQTMLEQAKMDNVLVMDVREKCDWTDYMIIADSTKGDKFLSSVAEHVGSTVRKAIANQTADLPMPHIEGRHDQSGWLLIDLGRCVVHLFTPEIRERYDLEGLWKSVPTDPSLPMPDQY
ncbi:hypothetical protein BC941DRAFT_435285 [Chlamydoabsidia padenii]|nr:hypothetical protein BC941DRAFT_435285 [Chlamydoabsidia padenii]